MLKNKKLLLLGGNIEKDYLKSFSDKNQIVLVAAGNNPNADYMQIADEAYNINNTDIERMKQFIVEHKIDGVYLGANETVIKAAVQYVNELGLPCCCNSYQWKILQDKRLFKKLCIQYDLPVVHSYEKGEDKKYPLMVKPARGNGSKGTSICRNEKEFEENCSKAILSGFGTDIIVEDLLENQATCCVYYIINNGTVYFAGMNDKYNIYYSNTKAYVGGLYLYRSIYEKEFRNNFENKIQNMLTGFGIQNGVISIEIFYKNGQYYFSECELRQSGNGAFGATKYLYGINEIDMICEYDLTGISPKIEINENANNYAIFPIHLKPGHIDKIEGLEELSKNKNIINISPRVKENDIVTSNGDYGNICFTVDFLFYNKNDLLNTIKQIEETIKVWDKDSNITNYLLDKNLIQWSK